MAIGEVAEVEGLMMGTGEGGGEEEGLREEVEVGEGGTGRTGVEAGTGVRGDRETKSTATTLEGQEIILSSGEEEEEAAEEVTSFSDRPSRRGKNGHRRFPSAW